MAAENDALLSGAKPHTSYTGFQDSSTSLGYIVKNTSATGKNQYLQKVDHYITKACQPWKFVVQVLGAREVLAEFAGTFVLVAIGNGAIAQTKLGPKPAFGEFLSINFGYALALMVACYVSIGVSGAHLNPAVTFAMALRGKMSWIKVLPFWVAQFLGAFLSAPVVYGIYFDAIHNATCGAKNVSCTGGIFATYPQPYLSLANGVLDQIFGTFFLVLGIFAVCDQQNSEPKVGLKPLLIGFILFAVGVAFGLNSGYAVNPARDFAPRLFTSMAGWGTEVFTCSNCGLIRQWWWVPIVAPMIGAAIAAVFYWFLIEAHHPPIEQIQLNTEGKKYVNETPQPRNSDVDEPATPPQDVAY